MKNIRAFFNDFKNGNFKSILKTKNGGTRFHDLEKIKKDNRFEMVKNWIENKYYNEGIGIKSLIKEFELPITYPILRKFMLLIDLKLRKNNEVTDWLRKKRKEKVKTEHLNKTGWFSDDVVRKNTKKGLQGYYFNKSLNKFVWLRSSYEYIYAKWLDEKNYIWDIEYKSFRLSDNSLYKPDFFIFDNKYNIKKIIEIKGYWNNRTYKYHLLKKEIKDVDLILINKDEIFNYTSNYKDDVKIWKILKEKNKLK